MDSHYKPKQHEEKIYKLWQESGFFNPDKLPGKRKKKYVIMIPPPNITGSLHIGHALNNTIQDLVIRFERMRNKKTLWLPGTDHAGISTQNVVEKELAKQGIARHQLGRKKFVKQVWQWKKKYGNLILQQFKKLGCSCDWSRTKFTLDKEYSQAVLFAFVHYYKKGLIYRGPRIVNWCPRCATAISDLEVKYREEEGKLWYLRYPLKPQSSSPESAFIIVATTRPETMLGDTAVAVNLKDKRYKDLIGKIVILPLSNREIPVIASPFVDQSFGTGAVKITPAHDPLDWKIGKKNNLEIVNVIGPQGKMTEEAGKYQGLKVEEAREKVLADLKTLNLIEKEEDYLHQVPCCDRCKTLIEPQISEQWFLKMEKLVEPAIKAVEKGKIKITPLRYEKLLLDWLKNIEDWCLSRQLFWGHRLPVWFCQNQTGKNSKSQIPNSKQIQNGPSQFVVSLEKPQKCPFCSQCSMQQTEDVTDTWFSSALWPFAALGWPEKTSDLKEFYPTEFLTTAQDILYLWVARMVFSSLEFTKKIPFPKVYIHPTILNIEGKRMSKSLGTGLDPLGLIEKYGADATRFGILLGLNASKQAMRFDERPILSARNFINKLWNISRFLEISTKRFPNYLSNSKFQTLPDKWIISRLNSIILSTTSNIENNKFGEAAQELYEFVWHEFADWYIEIAKFQITNSKFQKNTLFILNNSLFIILKLLHPFIPFVTEKIWLTLLNPPKAERQSRYLTGQEKNLLMVENWPQAEKKYLDKNLELKFIKIQEAVTKIRKKIPLSLEEFSKEEKEIIFTLSRGKLPQES